ncbi:MAG: hypothetical protein COW18_14335 [Zetaproteobacteria bacterium CG12_big_fil_rev_8_21_14_0_65_54_13]|nr:MAG: hypothetical protein COX55_02555 [Zetaproteobacteria bacterium CG23_combo_of_CG06-09_8_20_14_all_54_7]PIW44058.1 MAG: hypothetical protein COW18_14335 [Zetaproteobacteria bacterium CG12_big_fil_rev_8_21_14_0_65_54_13]PIX54736.1 MAG: hypothetical protein COZ50_06485 [Zetaproteobacteria bacterium CG_4_10_14_3_um_filter_54_28]PJA29376.1 MAG: hypothetical protein CO188_06760 [Zetaproteobacteria bacterium CG_4_9_14_3_um_filter_54_145]
MMEQKQQPEFNRARVTGRLQQIRDRWTPDGSKALIAELVTGRPQLGPIRAGVQNEQPLPLRATGDIVSKMVALDGQHVTIEGCLRRRFYSREGEPCWGQVEIWVDRCMLNEQVMESHQTRD